MNRIQRMAVRLCDAEKCRMWEEYLYLTFPQDIYKRKYLPGYEELPESSGEAASAADPPDDQGSASHPPSESDKDELPASPEAPAEKPRKKRKESA